jgi:solute carrier family 25 phosphate transporter 23/24/25/41
MDPGAISVQERFVAGGLAGATSQIMVYPLEIVKTRLALSAPGVYGGMVSCMSTIARAEGFRALYTGLSTSLVGVIPIAGIDLMVNSMLKDYASEYYEAQKKVRLAPRNPNPNPNP